MASKNVTREDIHSGLSQSKSDQKWSDMLNFRASDNRTFVVPRRLKLAEFDAGLHTIIRGVGSLNYAIGSKASYLFRNHDEMNTQRLWRVGVQRDTILEDQSENLKLRGCYLGETQKQLRLVVVGNELTLDTNWPQPEPEPVETPFVPKLNCGVSRNQPMVDLEVVYVDKPKWTLGEHVYYNAGQLIFLTGYNGFFVATSAHASTATTLTAAERLTSSEVVAWQRVYQNWHQVEIWDPSMGLSYSATITTGEWLVCDGDLYVAKADNLSPTLADMPLGANWGDYWEILPLGADISEVQLLEPNYGVSDFTPFASQSYVIGDIVSHNGSVYEAQTNHVTATNNEPGVGVNWTTDWTNITSTVPKLPARAATIQIWQGVRFIQQSQANANGMFSINLPANRYTFYTTYQGVQVIDTVDVSVLDQYRLIVIVL